MKLLAYLGQRLITMVPTVIGLVILTFFLARVVPADPIALIAGEGATREQIEALRQRYGFDLPLYTQLGVYLRQLASGDLGVSIYTGRPVLDDILERFPATIELTLVSIGMATLLGIPLGVLSALKRNSWLDHCLRTFTHTCRNTLPPNRRSMSCRASVEMRLSVAPCLPMTIALWLSRSTQMVTWMRRRRPSSLKLSTTASQR